MDQKHALSGQPAPDVLSPLHADLPWATVKLSVLFTGQRRLEASSYLTDGYGKRRLIESQPAGWTEFQEVADVWQPSRLKGVVVRQGAGLPFLSAGQVFEADPTVRKWLARSRVPNEEARYVNQDWLLLSCSGDVGRVTAVYPQLEGVIVTHDLLRLVPKSSADFGWLYAFLRTSTFKDIARTSQYGHMIKHLEPEHVQNMPIVMPSPDIREHANRVVTELLSKRREALSLRKSAEELYEKLVAPNGLPIAGTTHASVSTRDLVSSRRRLDATFSTPRIAAIQEAIRRTSTLKPASVREVTKSVEFGSRFKRFFGEKGSPYRSAAELFDLNAPVTKRIFSALVEHPSDYILRKGWLIMACSGQVYGLNGRAMLLGDRHDGVFGSHDLIRIVPDEDLIDTGYLLTALTHPELGRPMVIRNAYGTSIPHLDPIDIRELKVPRFELKQEEEIGRLARRAAVLRDEADDLEDAITGLAEDIVRSFAAQDVPSEPRVGAYAE